MTFEGHSKVVKYYAHKLEASVWKISHLDFHVFLWTLLCRVTFSMYLLHMQHCETVSIDQSASDWMLLHRPTAAAVTSKMNYMKSSCSQSFILGIHVWCTTYL